MDLGSAQTIGGVWITTSGEMMDKDGLQQLSTYMEIVTAGVMTSTREEKSCRSVVCVCLCVCVCAR